MSSPNVFISSTCYDLVHIRDSLEIFVENFGFNPVLSEKGDVYFDIEKHTHDACIKEVHNTQIFILIIGGRFGGNHRLNNASITNTEYREAVKLKLPIFTFVEQSVLADQHLYLENKKNSDIDETKISYPNVDNIKIFDFIDEVRKQSVNNAIFPFKHFTEIENCLKKQWAGMVHSFLTARSNFDSLNNILGCGRIKQNFREYILNAQNEIYITAITGCGLLSVGDAFASLMERGVHINLMLIRDKKVMNPMIDLYEGRTANERKMVQHNMKEVRNVIRTIVCEKNFKNGYDNGFLTIKSSCCVLPYAATAIDLATTNSSMRVQIYGYGTSTEYDPFILLYPDLTPEWYNYFSNNIQAMWKDANEFNAYDYL